jgi:23S rRNA pseudouridine2605 synthase
VPTPDYDVDSIPRVVQYDNETIEFESIEPAGGEGTNRWFRVESHRAHRRAAVRALFDSRGLKVSRVIQVRFGDFELPRDLPRGKHRELSEQEVAELYASVELALPTPPPKPESAAARAQRRRRPAPDRRKKPKRR